MLRNVQLHMQFELVHPELLPSEPTRSRSFQVLLGQVLIGWKRVNQISKGLKATAGRPS